jgi:hypothetical protein
MLYRYPRLGAVEVTPVDAAMRIAFAPGELGAVTSSGFYAPTRLCGDVDIRVRYVVRQWAPGPDSACLGLFLQNEASTARYYSQLMSTADAPDRLTVAAGLAGALSARRDAGREGWLRLARTGRTIAAAHRPHAAAPWVELARAQGTGDDLVAGAKIWSKVRCDGLVVDLYDLQIDGTLAAEQPPLLGPRPDPRRA